MAEFSIKLTTIVIPPLFRFTNGVNVAAVCCLYSLTRVIFPRVRLTKRLTEMKLRYNLAARLLFSHVCQLTVQKAPERDFSCLRVISGKKRVWL